MAPVLHCSKELAAKGRSNITLMADVSLDSVAARDFDCVFCPGKRPGGCAGRLPVCVCVRARVCLRVRLCERVLRNSFSLVCAVCIFVCVCVCVCMCVCVCVLYILSALWRSCRR